jgi:hypothetical protein
MVMDLSAFASVSSRDGECQKAHQGRHCDPSATFDHYFLREHLVDKEPLGFALTFHSL